MSILTVLLCNEGSIYMHISSLDVSLLFYSFTAISGGEVCAFTMQVKYTTREGKVYNRYLQRL